MVTHFAPLVRDDTRFLEKWLLDYHSLRIESVLDRIDNLLSEGDTVHIGGSVVHGLGNAASDLDVIVASPVLERTSTMPFLQYVGDLCVDVHRFSCSDVTRLLSRFWPAQEGAGTDRAVDATTQKLLFRVLFGVRVSGRETIAELPSVRDAFARLLARSHRARAIDGLFAVRLGIAAGSPGEAAAEALRMLEHAVESNLASRGRPFVGRKWLAARCRADDLGTVAALRDVLLLGSISGDGSGVDDAIQAAGELLGEDLEGTLAEATLSSRGVLRVFPLQAQLVALADPRGPAVEVSFEQRACVQSLAEGDRVPASNCIAECAGVLWPLYRSSGWTFEAHA